MMLTHHRSHIDRGSKGREKQRKPFLMHREADVQGIDMWGYEVWVKLFVIAERILE